MLNSLSHMRLGRLLGGALVLGVVLLAKPAWGAPPEQGSAGRDTKEEAVESIPFDKLTKETRTKLWEVVSKPSVYRRLPTQTVPCDPELYLFLMRYPEVVVNIWELMGITNVTAKRTGPFSLSTSDGAGTIGHVELIYGSQDMHVFYCEGYYEGPLFKKKLNGKCVLLLRSGYARDKEDRVQIANRLDMFLLVENTGVELVAKTLHPLVGKSADHNFVETAMFLGRMSQAAERNPAGFARMTTKLTSIEREVRDRFAELTAAIGARSEGAEKVGSAPLAEPDAIRSASLDEPRSSEPPRRIVTPR
jgi:hypothetical protein